RRQPREGAGSGTGFPTPQPTLGVGGPLALGERGPCLPAPPPPPCPAATREIGPGLASVLPFGYNDCWIVGPTPRRLRRSPSTSVSGRRWTTPARLPLDHH